MGCGQAHGPENRTQVTLAPPAVRSGAPGPLERHETPDPVRSNAVESRFHGVRPDAGRRPADIHAVWARNSLRAGRAIRGRVRKGLHVTHCPGNWVTIYRDRSNGREDIAM